MIPLHRAPTLLALGTLAACAPAPALPSLPPVSASACAPAIVPSTSADPNAQAVPSAPGILPDFAFVTTLTSLAERCHSAPAWVAPNGRLVAFCGSAFKTPVESVVLVFHDPDRDRVADELEISSTLDLDRAADWQSWMPLRRYDTVEDRTHPDIGKLAVAPAQAEGEGVTIRYHHPVLKVSGPDGKVLAQRAFPNWRAHPSMDGCHTRGGFKVVLGAVDARREHGVLVVSLLNTNSMEVCGGSTHVTRLPNVRAVIIKPMPTTP